MNSIWGLAKHLALSTMKNEICSGVGQFKGAQSQYFELFWPHTKLPLNGRKPENNSLIS